MLLNTRGVLAESAAPRRRMVAGVLGLTCITPIFTQWGYVGVQFANGGASYLMFMLMPVALTGLLLGPVLGAAAGLLQGLTLWMHARLIPLDYYELAYVTPVTSIVMTTVCGLVLGLLFADVLRSSFKGWRRAVALTISCLVASCVFSIGCALALGKRGLELGLTLDNVAFQIIGDTMILALISNVGITLGERGMRKGAEAGLRGVFGAWLSALVLVAFLAIGVVSYQTITASEFADATAKARDEVEFVLGHAERIARYDDVLVQAETESGRTRSISEDLLTSLFEGYSEDVDGLLVVESGGVVMGADADRVKNGATLEESLGADVAAAADASAVDRTLKRIIYWGPSETNDLIDLSLTGTKEEFAALLTPQVGYLMAAEGDGFRVVMVRPVGMVFAGRDDVIGWVFVSSVVLLLSMLALARSLLDRLVAQGIDRTNEALARITDGDLEARVEPEGTREFVELSEGINTTVDALQGWIAEAESRMDAELATAKAIQESALPNIFPPWPDIERFDIYASMNAAREVGGDFYDFFLIGDDSGPDAGRLAFVMADVSGKGVPAALFMMKAKTLLHDYLASGMDIGEAVENANHQLCEGNDEGMFVTAWIGVLDYATGHVDFVNAGHNPPLLWSAGAWSWVLQKSGLPLGLFDEMPYRRHALDCGVGEQILLYTDGVTEAFSVDEEQYGEERLLALAQECFALHPRELVDRVRASVAAHAKGAEQSDDITIMALEVGVPPEEKAQLVLRADIGELDRAFEFLRDELDRRLCPVRLQNQLDIAVEELFVNACKYAYEGMDASVARTVRITHSFSATPRSLTVEIIDDGVPFDPLAKKGATKEGGFDSLLDFPLGGLGIMMAKKNVDEMRYERVGDSNIVTLVKYW